MSALAHQKCGIGAQGGDPGMFIGRGPIYAPKLGRSCDWVAVAEAGLATASAKCDEETTAGSGETGELVGLDEMKPIKLSRKALQTATSEATNPSAPAVPGCRCDCNCDDLHLSISYATDGGLHADFRRA